MPLLAFTSPKGGVGKSTLAAHMAAVLRQRGHAVIALDLDPQNALRLHLGVSMREQGGFLARIDQLPDWHSSRMVTPSGVDLLAFGTVDSHRALMIGAFLLQHPDALAKPLREMLAQPGLIVIADTPPGPSAALEALTPLTDLFCMVLLADAGSAALIPEVASGQMFGRGTMGVRTAERLGLIMNQVDFDQPLAAAVMDCAMHALGHRMLGAVCRDPALSEALATKHLLTDGDSKAGEDLQILADKILSRLNLPVPRSAAGGYRALTEWGLR
jgi:cellulose synthase operon protein YhjQ